MINLLSGERKDELRAARANVILLRYMSIIALAFLFITGALYVSYVVLTATKTSAEGIISNNDIKTDVYSETKQQVDTLSAQLNDAKTLIDQEVLYSQFLVRIGQVTPAGTVVGDITLTTANFVGTPIEMTVYAKSADSASLIQNQFQTSGLFTQVTLKGTETDKGIEDYPVSIGLTVVLSKARI